MAGSITAAELRRRYQAGGEIAIVDAREEGSFHERHLLMASCLPLSRLELIAPGLLPRRSAPIVVCDAGEGLAERAAARLIEGGYTDVSVLAGGVAAWEAAGFPVYSGVHVPSKAFAEVVEHEYGTPWISAEELAERQKSGEPMAIFDSRSYEEYHSNTIPGAISVPGAELVYRFSEMVPSPDTFVVVNCGGRTRSIIGAQSLIDAGVPNRVVSLKDGTMAWHLAGLGVVAGATGRAPEVSADGVAAARQRADAVARRYGVPINRSRDPRRMAARGRPAHPLCAGCARPGRIPRRPPAGIGHGARRSIGAGDRQLARRLGRPRRIGRRHRGQGAHDGLMAAPHGLGCGGAGRRAFRRGAGAQAYRRSPPTSSRWPARSRRPFSRRICRQNGPSSSIWR